MIASAGSLSSVGLWRLYRANFVAEYMGAVALSELTAQFDDRICTITLNRPGQLNCVNDAMMSLFETTLASLEATERLNGVILTAMGGRSFCSGGDLTWLKTLNNPDSGARMGRRMQSILERLSRLACPVICVLNGFALGVGQRSRWLVTFASSSRTPIYPSNKLKWAYQRGGRVDPVC